MKNRKRKSIVTQTVLRVSFVFILVLLIVIPVFTWYTGTYMRDQILEAQQEQMDMVTDSLEGRLEGMMEMAVSLAKYQPTIALLGEYYETYSPDWMENIRKLDAYLQNVSLFTEYIVDINLISTDSETAYSLRDVLRSDYPYTDQEWFLHAVEQQAVIKYAPPHGKDHLYNTNMGDTFSLIYPVYQSSRLLGYEILECELLGIADFLNQRSQKESGYLLLDEQNRPIFGAESGQISDELLLGLSELQTAEKRTWQESGSIYSSYKLKANDWTLILGSDEGILLKPVQSLILVVILLAVLTAVIVAGINLYNIRVMEKPINTLIARISSYDGSGAVSPGDYSETPKELAVIGERFDDMAGKVNTLINDVYVAQLQQKEAELEALLNQINPHFLYNVFQLIQTKAVLSDNQEIEDMIQALSKMMRYAMERKRDRVSVEEELGYIQNYLMFYKERFPLLFTYEITGAETVAEYQTIKFILQPVVENCFRHAFKNQKEGGQIRIHIEESQENLYFHVRDNGAGMTEEQLQILRDKLEGNTPEGGIGVVNTHERIRLVYGYPYGISVESRIGEYTEVTLKIKKERQ